LLGVDLRLILYGMHLNYPACKATQMCGQKSTSFETIRGPNDIRALGHRRSGIVLVVAPSFRKIMTVLNAETRLLDGRLWLATLVCGALPALVGNRLRTTALRFAGVSIGRGTTIGGSVHVSSGRVGAGRAARRLTIGHDCWINADCTFDLSTDIVIGDGVSIAPGVAFVTNTHDIGPADNRAGYQHNNAIHIGAGTWLGTRSTILPGVTIGSGCVVAAGSVVTKSVEPNMLVGGVPARVIRLLSP